MSRVPGRREVPSRSGNLRQRARYRFDNVLARGTWAPLVWLGAVTLLAVLASSLLLTAFDVTFAGSEQSSWWEDFWQSLLRVMDPGTMAGDVGWGRRVLALLITVFGLLVAGTLIGIIASGVEDRIEQMRRGRSAVFESGHFVVLGSAGRLPVLVQELVRASAGSHDTAIVVLADRDPAAMREEVRQVVGEKRKTRLVFRSGDPSQPSDLGLVGLADARAVIILRDEAGGDASAIKTLLAVETQMGGFESAPIVIELGDPSTASRVRQACGSGVHPLVPSQAVGRSAAFALREPGASHVVRALLDFRGPDIHVRDADDLVGVAFRDLVLDLADARPIGRMRVDGHVELHPAPATCIEVGDRLVVIADDERALERVTASGAGRPAGAPAQPAMFDAEREPEHLLVVGWNELGRELLGHWAEGASPGSTIDIVFDPALCSDKEIVIPRPGVEQVTILPAASPSGITQRPADAAPITTIVLLAYAGRLSAEEADTRTLLDLLTLRRELESGHERMPRIMVELLRVDSLPLAALSGPDDYVVSQAIGSRLLAQLAAQPERRAVLLELYAGHGPSIRLVAAERLGLIGDGRVADIIRRCYEAGLIAIGWRRATRRGGDLVLNPSATGRATLEAGDEIVVIAGPDRHRVRPPQHDRVAARDSDDLSG